MVIFDMDISVLLAAVNRGTWRTANACIYLFHIAVHGFHETLQNIQSDLELQRAVGLDKGKKLRQYRNA